MTGFDIERAAWAGFLLAVSGALFWLLLTPGSASAHANLARSEPAGNEVLKEAPERVVVWFTEEIERSFSKIEVLDSNGSRVDNGGSTVDSNNLKVMSVSLPPIPNGSYTVAWKNVSTVDGHRVRGSFVFSVGEALAPGIAAPAERPLLESAAEPFARWLMLGGALALAGGLLFALVVAAPGIEASHCGPRLSALLYGRWWVVTWAGAGAFAGGSLAQLVVQSSSFAEVGVVEALGGPAFTVLADTTWGRLWLLRALALAAVAAVLAVAYVRTGAGRQPSTRLLLAAGLPSAMLMLLSLSLASHAAGTSAIRGPATLTDYIHLLASAAWAGGLMHFAAVVPVVLREVGPESDRLLRALTPRFSVVAGLSVGLIIVTGLYGYWAQVTIPAALKTPYGFALLAKVAIVAPLLLLGAANIIIIRPRLADSATAARWLRRLVATEGALVVLVLLAVGYLTSLEPARQVASREGIGQPSALSFEGVSEGARIALTLEPVRVGPNSVTVDLKDRFDAPITNATDVRLTLSYLGLDLGEEPVSAKHTGGGRYVLEEALLGIAGDWEIEVLVRRPDAFDARTAFRFEAIAGIGGSATIGPSPDTGMLLLGIELGTAGVIFLVVGLPLGGWYSRRGAAIMGVGLLLFAAGAVAVFNGQAAGPEDDALVRNPFPPDAESLAEGLAVYESSCQVCHGERGRGDGPGAAGMDPLPADLVEHVPLHPDRDLYRFIDEGIAGTAMVPLGDRLSEEEIWHVINYIQALE